MSQQQTVNGYIGVRSAKLSSIYADNYVVSAVTSTGGFSDDGATLVIPLDAGAVPVLTVNTITINSTSGFFTTLPVISTAAGRARLLVNNDTVQLGSQILLTAAPTVATGYDADYDDFACVEVGLILNGSFEVSFRATAATANQDFLISFTILNPSA